ncbi:glycosyltransferase family 4 protein [Accumulibacter sp.]|uniref:glycosyltransferase family 4 protein n=1 Tax=Accumulibacter sp. TaxID=2053492 RepID=UPI00338E9CE7
MAKGALLVLAAFGIQSPYVLYTIHPGVASRISWRPTTQSMAWCNPSVVGRKEVVKILLVHNFYGSASPSGENQAFEVEKALLAARGHVVAQFTRTSDELRGGGVLGVARGGLATPWNPWMVSALGRLVAMLRPDVVHVHNTFPLISPGIFHAIGQQAARVLTLHNYRLFCPGAVPMRDGRPCTECLDRRSSWPAVKHACYRNSRLATLPLALSVGVHRMLKTWTHEVDAFVALSEFQRWRMAESGLPLHKVHVKPNFYPGRPPVVPWVERSSYVVFAGRLTVEKGLTYLLQAWQEWGHSAPELRILGDGELRSHLTTVAAGLPVRFLGQLSNEEAEAQIAGARLLILPSVCFEGFPMVLREAFAFGTPAAVADIGPLPSIVEHGRSGVVFAPANPESLLREARLAWDTPGLLERLGQGARREFEARYTEEANYATLMSIYDKAISVSRSGGDTRRTS